MALTTLERCKEGHYVTIRFLNTEIVTGTFVALEERPEGHLGAGVVEMDVNGRQCWFKAGMVEAVFRETKPRAKAKRGG